MHQLLDEESKLIQEGGEGSMDFEQLNKLIEREDDVGINKKIIEEKLVEFLKNKKRQ
jgi:hypothetical protein